MTSPTDPTFAQRLKVSATAVGTENPQLANLLATSGLSQTQIQAVGGFTGALSLNTANQLAADSGVATNFTTGEQNSLAAINAAPANQPQPDTRSWLEKAADAVGTGLADGGNFIFHNPVTHALETGLNWIGNAAHMPFRLASAAVSEDTQARDAEMKADGYDPTSTVSKLAFMFSHGEDEYHDLSHVRQQYGDDLVDLAVQQANDPEQFQKDLEQMDPAQAQALNDKLNGQEFKDAQAAVDALHISPGRDLANIVMSPFGVHSENNEVFKLLSGVTDAAYDWFSDPTLIFGKVNAGIRAADVLGRVSEDMTLTQKLMTKVAGGDGALAQWVQKRAGGITHTVDQAGIYKLLGVDEATGEVVADTAYGRAWTQFAQRAKQIREQTAILNDTSASAEAKAAATTERVKILTQMNATQRALMPLLDEFNGVRVIAPKVQKFDDHGALVREESAAEEWARLAGEAPRRPTEQVIPDDVLPDDFFRRAADGHLQGVTNETMDRLDEVLSREPTEEAATWSTAAAAQRQDVPGGSADDWFEEYYAARAQAMREHLASQMKLGYDVQYINDAGRPVWVTDPSQLSRIPEDTLGDGGGIGLAPTGTRPVRTPATPPSEAETYDRTLNTRGGGGWLATQGKPLEELPDIAQYLVSTNGLARLANGEPAQQLMVMPGRVSLRTEWLAARKANRAAKYLDYSGKTWAKTMPIDEEGSALAALDGLSDADRAAMGDRQRNMLRTGTPDGKGFNYFARVRARMERLNRRMGTILPRVQNFDLTDASTLRDVENFARFYLSKGDAKILAAKYAAGDLAARRAVVRGMLVQSFHASGLSRSAAGQEFMRKYVGDLDGVDQQMYGLEGSDLVGSDRGQIHAALSNAQLSTSVPMPSLKEMNQLALRFQTDGWLATRGVSAGLGAMQSNRMDALYGHIKMGWITSPAGGLRNALDELAGFMAKGMFNQWVKGRLAWTQATGDTRDEAGNLVRGVRGQRIDRSKEYRDLAKQYGQIGARDEVSRMSGNAQVDLEKATRDHRRAVNAQQARDTLEDKLQARYDKANEHYTYHQDAHFDAVSQLRALLRDDTSTPEAIQAARDRVAETEANVETWSQARGKAKMQQTKLPETRAKLEETFQKAGVLDVDQAEQNLATAKLQFEHARGLENAIHYRIPYMLRRFGDSVNDALFGVTAGKLLRVFGPRWVPTPQQVEWIRELQTEEMRAVLRDGIQQVRYGQNYSAINGPQAAMDLHRVGGQARSYSYMPNGWGEVEPDGGQGLDDFAKFLQLHLGDPREPAHAWVQAYKWTKDAQATPSTWKQLDRHIFEDAAAGRLPGVDPDLAARLGEAMEHVHPDDRGITLLGMHPSMNDVPNIENVRDLSGLQREVLYQHLKHELDNGRSIQIQHGDWEDENTPFDEVHTLDELHMMLARNPDDLDHPELIPLSGDLAQADLFKVQRGGPAADPIKAARDSVRAYLDDPAMRHFLANAEIARTLNDGSKVTDAATLARAKDELADRISANMMHGLFSRQGDGKINETLLDQLAVADQIGTPDASWIAHNVPADERPAHTVGQLWAPYNAAHMPGRFPVGYTPMLTKFYGKVVTDQIDALSRNPLIAALYMNARAHIQPWEQHLVASGWDEESAKAVAQRMSLAHAEQEAFKHVDNPHVASQFSLISRNFVNFERAQEDWLRRWGRAIKDNPSIIRKAQLTLHAGTAAGLVEQDPTNPDSAYFVYPGSQLAIGMFNKAMKGLGLGEQVQIPVLGELTSQLQFLSPSLSQPFGLTASPIISLPFKAIASTVGQDHQLLMNSLDKALNGTLGSGRSWYEQILPPTINRILRGVVESDPASQYGQAYANATAALASAGAFDKLDGTDPTAISNAQDALGVQVRNNMALNALFGLFAPAVPGVDYDSHSATGQGTTPDWSAHMLGWQSLKQEAQQVLADLGRDKAALWWAAVHPHELMWDPTAGVTSHTASGTNHAFLPATIPAAKWIEDNQGGFLAKYGGAGGIAAYFVPGSGAANQSFNDIAYRAQLQDHMREYKPLNQLLPDIIIQRGESEYYAAKDNYDAQIQAAKDSGNRSQATQLENQWSTEKQDIYKRNPLLAQKNASYAVNGSEQQVAIGRLQALVDDVSPETQKAIGSLRDGVSILLSAYNDYNAGTQALAGRRGNAATQARAQLAETYKTEAASVAQQYPDLADLVRGVFRTP